MAAAGHFADRSEAGRRLAEALPPLTGELVVLGLARGGVPVAAEVAHALDAPLDVLVVRKVGHPAQPEYALGAVSEDGVTLPPGLPEHLVAPQMHRAREQARVLRRAQERRPLAGRVVLVVDDGLATGRSMVVGLETVARHQPAQVAMAVPVASGPGLRDIQARWPAWAALVVEPPEFVAVGQFYDDFAQVGDDEVVGLLAGG